MTTPAAAGEIPGLRLVPMTDKRRTSTFDVFLGRFNIARTRKQRPEIWDTYLLTPTGNDLGMDTYRATTREGSVAAALAALGLPERTTHALLQDRALTADEATALERAAALVRDQVNQRRPNGHHVALCRACDHKANIHLWRVGDTDGAHTCTECGCVMTSREAVLWLTKTEWENLR